MLVSTVPSWGHLVPMLGVIRAFGADGHDVLVATNPAFHPAVTSLGLKALAAGMSDSEMLAERAARWPATKDRPPQEWAMHMFTEIAAPAMSADLAPLIDSGWPDLVLCEEGEYGGVLAAARTGTPVITHGWGTPRSAASRADGHIDPCPPSMAGDIPDGRRWVVRFAVSQLVTAEPETAAWVAARQRPLAHVGFGTVPFYRDAPGVVAEMIVALDACGLDAICTVGDPADPAYSEVAVAGVRFESFVSLPDLLPRCSLVVSHGGAGTTLAALAHGLPVLVLPRGAPSQQRMADSCVARGVGRAVLAQGSTQEQLRAEVDALLGRPSYRAEATAVAEEMTAAPEASAVAASLCEFVERGLHR